MASVMTRGPLVTTLHTVLHVHDGTISAQLRKKRCEVELRWLYQEEAFSQLTEPHIILNAPSEPLCSYHVCDTNVDVTLMSKK